MLTRRCGRGRLLGDLQCFPLQRDAGLGPVLDKTRAAAVRWADLIRASGTLRLVVEPALDIVAFYPLPPDGDRRVSAISALTEQVFQIGMDEGAFYLGQTERQTRTAHEP